MADYDMTKLDPNYEEMIFNEGPIENNEQLKDYFADRGIDPEDMPVDFIVWEEGAIQVGNAPAESEWINIGSAGRYADVLSDGTHVMASSEPDSRAGEIITWLHKNCKGPFVIHADGEDDHGNVGFEVMLLDRDDLMRFKLSFHGHI